MSLHTKVVWCHLWDLLDQDHLAMLYLDHLCLYIGGLRGPFVLL